MEAEGVIPLANFDRDVPGTISETLSKIPADGAPARCTKRIVWQFSRVAGLRRYLRKDNGNARRMRAIIVFNDGTTAEANIRYGTLVILVITT